MSDTTPIPPSPAEPKKGGISIVVPGPALTEKLVTDRDTKHYVDLIFKVAVEGLCKIVNANSHWMTLPDYVSPKTFMEEFPKRTDLHQQVKDDVMHNLVTAMRGVRELNKSIAEMLNYQPTLGIASILFMEGDILKFHAIITFNDQPVVTLKASIQ